MHELWGRRRHLFQLRRVGETREAIWRPPNEIIPARKVLSFDTSPKTVFDEKDPFSEARIAFGLFLQGSIIGTPVFAAAQDVLFGLDRSHIGLTQEPKQPQQILDRNIRIHENATEVFYEEIFDSYYKVAQKFLGEGADTFDIMRRAIEEATKDMADFSLLPPHEAQKPTHLRTPKQFYTDCLALLRNYSTSLVSASGDDTHFHFTRVFNKNYNNIGVPDSSNASGTNTRLYNQISLATSLERKATPSETGDPKKYADNMIAHEQFPQVPNSITFEAIRIIPDYREYRCTISRERTHGRQKYVINGRVRYHMFGTYIKMDDLSYYDLNAILDHLPSPIAHE